MFRTYTRYGRKIGAAEAEVLRRIQRPENLTGRGRGTLAPLPRGPRTAPDRRPRPQCPPPSLKPLSDR